MCNHEKAVDIIKNIENILTGKLKYSDIKKAESEADAWEGKAKDTGFFSQSKQNKRAKKMAKELSKIFKNIGIQFQKRVKEKLDVFFLSEFITKGKALSDEDWEEITKGIFQEEEMALLLNKYTEREVFLAFDESFEEVVRIKEIPNTHSQDFIDKEFITKAGKELESYEIKLSEATAKTVDLRLKSIIQESLEQGDSVPNTVRKVKETYNNMSNWKATQIARTELTRASARGSLAAYSELEVEKFELLISPGACPICTARKNYNPFSVLNPGGGRPPLHPSCRCTVVPLLE